MALDYPCQWMHRKLSILHPPLSNKTNVFMYRFKCWIVVHKYESHQIIIILVLRRDRLIPLMCTGSVLKSSIRSTIPFGLPLVVLAEILPCALSIRFHLSIVLFLCPVVPEICLLGPSDTLRRAIVHFLVVYCLLRQWILGHVWLLVLSPSHWTWPYTFLF